MHTFEVDGDNRITVVSENWDAFALENEGQEACASRVLGRSWSDFVAGAEMRMLFDVLLDRVRKSRLHLMVPFRCDGPTVRRYMTMTIIPKPNNAVLFRCELVREEPRDAVRVLSRGAARGSGMLTLCGWCGKAEVDAVWVDLDEAIRTLRLFDADELPALSHGICPVCEGHFNRLVVGD